MAALVLALLTVFLSLTGHTSANYCLCKDGVAEQALQKAIDYACGAGADCTPILQNGACFQPNTVKDHCNYAVNSYFQRKGQSAGTCDFSGSASPSVSPPTGVSSTCVFPASPGNAGTSPGANPGTGTGMVPGAGTGTGTVPGAGTGGMGTGTGTGTGTGMVPGSTGTTPSVFGTGSGLGPTGSGLGDSSGVSQKVTNLMTIFASTCLTLLVSGL